VARVLEMAALELRDPVALVVLVKTTDRPAHRYIRAAGR
jgi:hypothetical protein